MPYNKITDLPDGVKKHLPKHAQEIYLESFNHAWEEYRQKSKRRTDESLEQISHKVAWSAVKKKYHKVGTDWKEK
ncbi:MAG: ChaB family protein [Alphaproteobacteria bacterium]|nr:ChaB family protein [Alphaproteobacteria bacterium]OJV12125.1 MAG: cation transport regulator ChaB [Alphaproteobacteria bacterium 33-17]